MIGAIKGNIYSANKPSFAQQNTVATPSFKQRYAEMVKQGPTVASGDRQTGLGIEDDVFYHFFANVNRQADGCAELTEDDIRALRQKYDLDNLTSKEQAELLIELSQKNVLSYTDCANAWLKPVVVDPRSLPGKMYNQIIERYGLDIEPVDENREIVLDGQSLAVEPFRRPTNFYELLQDYEQYLRKRDRIFWDEYGQASPSYLAYADSAARTAKVIKLLM